ncbi:hypothetical protein M9Y10_027253 [Tritrichomonas musculus]|uniref:Uncharacterized protein n=1 Tax=Tritrichomonas musculus TaxID=1915356 RepID=A0ABR2H5Z3_9EUKA
MHNRNNEITLLYIKNRKVNQVPIAEQTKRIRKKTNLKIEELGDKYLLIKDLFEKLRIKRDELYYFGKQLEMEFKEIKKGIHLQNQIKRMKEALYCWYAEHFFTEIYQFNSLLLKRMAQFTNNPAVLYSLSKYQSNMMKIQKKQIEKQSNKVIKTQMEINEFILTETKANQEIDSFEYSNINMENSNQKDSTISSDNNMFDFEKLLNF